MQVAYEQSGGYPDREVLIRKPNLSLVQGTAIEIAFGDLYEWYCQLKSNWADFLPGPVT